MHRARTCNYKVGQFPVKAGWRDAPFALQNSAEAIKQNILIKIKICQIAQKYLNSNKKLLKSIAIFEIEWKYLNLNKILSMNTNIFKFKWKYLNLNRNLLNRIKIFECE